MSTNLDATPIEDLELSVRTIRFCQLAGITTLGQLRQVHRRDVVATKGFGSRTWQEIREVVASTYPKPEMPMPAGLMQVVEMINALVAADDTLKLSVGSDGVLRLYRRLA